MNIKSFLGNAILLFSSILISLLLGEFIVRFFAPQVTSPSQAFYDEQLGGNVPVPNQKGFKNHPGVYYYEYQNNDIGLRDTRSTAELKKIPFKILNIGDSFAYGWGVNDEETFSKITEKSLDSDTIAVLNAGSPGAGSDYSLRFLETRGKELSPKIVVYYAFDNDFFDNLANSYYHIESDSIIRNTEASLTKDEIIKKNNLALNPYYNWFCKNSQLFCLIRTQIGNFRNRKKNSEVNKSAKTEPSNPKMSEKLNEKTSNPTAKNTPPINSTTTYKIDITKPTDHDFELMQHYTCLYAKAMNEYCKKNNIQYIVVYIPSYEMIHSSNYKNEKALEDFCKMNKISFYSLKDSFIKTGKPVESYFLHEYSDAYLGHWNKEGNKVAASYLTIMLKRDYLKK